MTAHPPLKWVAIGGGTGLATLLAGLKARLDEIHAERIELTGQLELLGGPE